jgi:hypothetical protein
VLVNFCLAGGGIFHFCALLNRLWEVGDPSKGQKIAKIAFFGHMSKLEVFELHFFNAFTTANALAKLRDPFDCEEA